MNIVLTGMPGAGKSTVGVVLAKALKLSFVDTDLIIQNKTGKLLQSIIREEGREKFLKIEETVIFEENIKNSVIATGGSVIYSEKAMKRLKTDGIAVFLDVPLQSLITRINNFNSRGIVMLSEQSFEDIYNERLPLYRKYADITVTEKGGPVEKTVDRIIGALKEDSRAAEINVPYTDIPLKLR